jgi:hypothetical protein
MRVVLLAAAGTSTDIVFNALEGRHELAGVIIEDRVPRWRYLWRRARRLGAAEAVGQVLFQTLVPPLLRTLSRRRIEEIISAEGLDTRPIPEAAITRVESANSAESRALLQRLDPDVVVINGTRILDVTTLSAVPVPFVNIHTGITPAYRGVHGAYWALATGDPANCGVTVHEVDRGLDTGRILQQARVAVTSRDNFVTYPLLQMGAGVPLLLRYLEAPEASAGPVARDAEESRAWSHPTLWGYLRTLARTGTR